MYKKKCENHEEFKYVIGGRIRDGDSSAALGNYNFIHDEIAIHLGRTWRFYNTVDEFNERVMKSIIHEYLHQVIIKTTKKDGLDLGILNITKNEWIVQKLLEEEMDGDTLESYIIDDIHNFRVNNEVVLFRQKLKKIYWIFVWILVGLVVLQLVMAKIFIY